MKKNHDTLATPDAGRSDASKDRTFLVNSDSVGCLQSGCQPPISRPDVGIQKWGCDALRWFLNQRLEGFEEFQRPGASAISSLPPVENTRDISTVTELGRCSRQG